MPCRSPLVAYRDLHGVLKFKKPENAWDKTNSLMAVACGRCRDCRMRRAREWAIRCDHERRMHRSSSFLTLTFQDDPVTIRKNDLQRFFKRLRKRYADQGIKRRISYFACGEYGEKLSRPHYHVILFGEDFAHDRYPWQKSKGGVLYRSPSLEKLWPHGYAKIGEVTTDSAGYTARYVQKKQYGAGAIDHYIRHINGNEVHVNPEFQLQSHKPAIGIRWLEKYWQDVFPADKVVYKGREYPAPKAYLTWLKVNHPDLAKEVIKNRQQEAKDTDRESGEVMHISAKARDQKYKQLRRKYEDQNRP